MLQRVIFEIITSNQKWKKTLTCEIKYYIKNLANPIDLDDAVNERFTNSHYLKITDYDNISIVRNNSNTIFNNITFTGLDSIYVNRNPKNDLELCTKIYTDLLVFNHTIVRDNKDSDLNNHELSNIKAISLNVDPNKKFDDFDINNFVPKSVIDEFVSSNIDEQSLLRLHSDEKLQLAGKDFIILESNLTNPKTILYIPLNTNLVRRDRDTNFNGYSLSKISNITVNSTSHSNEFELVTKGYVDSENENHRTRRDLSFVHNDQDTMFDNNQLTKLDSIQVNRDPILDQEVDNRKFIIDKIDEKLDENTIVRLNDDSNDN